MCEYCLNEWYKRNTYILKGTNNCDAEIKLSLEGEEGLLINGEWVDDFRSNNDKFIKMGFSAEAFVRYCPWCERKLKNDKS